VSLADAESEASGAGLVCCRVRVVGGAVTEGGERRSDPRSFRRLRTRRGGSYRRVIATLWSVYDQAAAKVTQMVYDDIVKFGQLPQPTSPGRCTQRSGIFATATGISQAGGYRSSTSALTTEPDDLYRALYRFRAEHTLYGPAIPV
jgi:hypothetical protein